jgi:cyclohexanone monooxygenase
MGDGAPTANGTARRVETLDAVVVGAGWAGMYMLHRLRELGLAVRCYELGRDVGGTWYWNRYPGARCDVPSLSYSFTFSEALWADWNWSERYGTQPEIEQYAHYVMDRLDLQRDIQFNTRVLALVYDEQANRWTVTTDQGDRISSTFCFMATGGYTVPLVPDIEDIDAFTGQLYYTAKWPFHPVDFRGRRVGVIGTGSSGMQVSTKLGSEGEVAELFVFQRTANFAVPGKNSPLDPERLREFKKKFQQFRTRLRDSGAGANTEGPIGPVADLSQEEFLKLMDDNWARGVNPVAGISDYGTSEKANDMVAEYCRDRVRERVLDPQTAELLCARGHYFSERRLLVEDGYFEIYNQANVTLVDVRGDPIRRLVPSGLETESGRRYELDMIVLATGFDSGTGGMLQIAVTGRDGTTLAERWANGPVTYLGVQTSGFPNLFMLAGPGSPSIRSNMMVSIEQHVEWLSELIGDMRAKGVESIEAAPAAEAQWTQHVAATVNATLMARHDTQYVGSNVPGKPRVYLAYVGGVPTYRMVCDRVRQGDYEGFVLRRNGRPLLTTRLSWSGPPNEPWLRTRWASQLGSPVV